VDLHGQHEHQSLLKGDRQLELLDAFAGTEAAAEDVRARVSALRATERMIEQITSDDRDRTRQLEFLRFEVEEIDAAGITPGEDDDVRSRLNRITNAERIYTLANEAYSLLYDRDEASTTDTLNAAAHALHELSGIDPQFEALAQQAAETQAALEALSAEVRAHTEQVEYDAQELDELNRRSVFLRDLKRKYGATLEEVLAYRARAAEELGNYENRDLRLETLRKQHADQLAKVMALAAVLSDKRRAAARKLDKQVSTTLQELGMRGARFQTDQEPVELNGAGVDKVTFMLAANTGEDLKPLRQVASGGEVSRIMLALKSVFASADTIPTLIFDEIDAGVGGAVARNVAAQLAALAKSHQVICITHIPQIAAVACAHFNVAKQSAKGRTTTTVVQIDEDARVREIARLLDGTVSEVSLAHARVLLAAEA
jgi:DNA repair protein RecN (Recombination protein N)